MFLFDAQLEADNPKTWHILCPWPELAPGKSRLGTEDIRESTEKEKDLPPRTTNAQGAMRETEALDVCTSVLPEARE